MEVRLVTPDTRAQPGEPSPAESSGPRELLRYRSAQGRPLAAAMILGSSVAGIDSTVVAVALPAIGQNLHAGFPALQWIVTSYPLTLASLSLLTGSLSDHWGRRVFLAGSHLVHPGHGAVRGVPSPRTGNWPRPPRRSVRSSTRVHRREMPWSDRCEW
jgi:Major Facilitator Superfamily